MTRRYGIEWMEGQLGGGDAAVDVHGLALDPVGGEGAEVGDEAG